MALSDATRLADFATGVGTDGTLNANNINATGIVTATSFSGIAATSNVSTSGLYVVGVSTFAGIGTFKGDAWVSGALTVGGNLSVTGDITYDEVSGRNLSISGITTVNTFGATGISTVGILTAYDSITVKVGSGSTELTTAIKTNTTNISTNTTNIAAKASTGKAIAMAMVFG